jgi:hypothetical protein
MPAAKRHPVRLPTGPKEQDTVRAICQYLAFHKIPHWRMTTGALRADKRFIRFGAVGMADIIGIITVRSELEQSGEVRVALPPVVATIRGIFLAIEVKSATGRLRPAQQAFLDTVTAAGGRAFVARSVEDVRKELGL